MENIHKHLLRKARPWPELAKLIRRNGPLAPQPEADADLFSFLAETVISQQLSVKAADTIWQRVLDLKRKRRVKRVSTLAQPRHRESLRACGISGRKVEAIIRLAESLRRGDLQPQFIRNASHEEIITNISALYGFGPWSAEMASMFYAGQPDVWSPGDVALVRGLRNVTGEDVDQAEVVASFSPYRTYLALHIWRHEDNVPINGS